VKNFWQSLTTATHPVRSNFMNERVTVDSSGRLSGASKGHGSTRYNDTGKHLASQEPQSDSYNFHAPS